MTGNGGIESFPRTRPLRLAACPGEPVSEAVLYADPDSSTRLPDWKPFVFPFPPVLASFIAESSRSAANSLKVGLTASLLKPSTTLLEEDSCAVTARHRGLSSLSLTRKEARHRSACEP